MKIDIIVVYQRRYTSGHEANFVPPITGIHLAAITPPEHHVRVVHQQVETVNFETNADLIALSFSPASPPKPTASQTNSESAASASSLADRTPHSTPTKPSHTATPS